MYLARQCLYAVVRYLQHVSEKESGFIVCYNYFQEVEVEDRTHFAIINPRTAAPTVAVSSISITMIIAMNTIPQVY